MENLGQLKVVEEHVREARGKGAEVLCGGERLGKGLPGYFFPPTVLTQRRSYHEDHDRGDLRPGASDHALIQPGASRRPG